MCLISFHALLRVGEVAALDVEDVVFLDDLIEIKVWSYWDFSF